MNETYFIERMLKKKYMRVEKYLENILNSTSTINKILKYYQVGFSTDHTKMYLMFHDNIIHTYGISKDDYYRELRMEIWFKSCITVTPPTSIPDVLPK